MVKRCKSVGLALEMGDVDFYAEGKLIKIVDVELVNKVEDKAELVYEIRAEVRFEVGGRVGLECSGARRLKRILIPTPGAMIVRVMSLILGT
ncbi:hypothetical protein NL676_000117 [Syzygium grande]|nr:hypothetical protein NL676_000117 [Syzygium grande]